MNNLNELLSQPLAIIEDNQFSEQVLKRINNYFRWRSLVLKSLSIALFLLFLVLSSPVLLLEKIAKASNLLSLELTQLPLIDINAVSSQIQQQPTLAIVFIVSLVMIFGLQEN